MFSWRNKKNINNFGLKKASYQELNGTQMQVHRNENLTHFIMWTLSQLFVLVYFQ